MTQFNLETTERLSIQGYDTGSINIALSSGSDSAKTMDGKTKKMTSSFILTPSQIIEDWNYQNVTDFTPDSFKLILDQRPELVILGTGEKLTFPNQAALATFHQVGIGVEVMNTSSACRTFNVLVSENRFVIAGFLII